MKYGRRAELPPPHVGADTDLSLMRNTYFRPPRQTEISLTTAFNHHFSGQGLQLLTISQVGVTGNRSIGARCE